MAETLELQQVVCPSCKQVITSFNPFKSEVECPWCHNKAFNPLITAKKVPVPERLIIFTTKEKEFERSLIQSLVDQDYVPRDIFATINPGNVFKAYLPMFLYEGQYSSSWTCEVGSEEYEVRASGGKAKEQKVIKWRPMSGTAQGNFSFLSLAYEGKEIPEELKEFAQDYPYNAITSKEYDPDLLGLDSEDAPTTLALNADPEVIWSKVGDGVVKRQAQKNAEDQMPDQMTRNFHVSTQYNMTTRGRYVLAPFWFVYYRYNDTRYYYIMDGLGQGNSFSYPVDQNEVKYVKNKNFFIGLVKWLWPLAALMWYLFGFGYAIAYLVVWFIAKIVIKKVFTSQIKKRLRESKAARNLGAQRLMNS